LSVKEVGEWITVIGAAVAAITGIWNLLLQFRGKRDHFVVGLGSVSPVIEQETMMHVVSHSDHRIKLTDWGFIDSDGGFQSVRMSWESGVLTSEEITTRGSSDLAARGDTLESGYIRETPLGAFATSATRTRPRVCFDSTAPHWRRLWIRLRLLWVGSHYLA
jgi:hypothetical protein